MFSRRDFVAGAATAALATPALARPAKKPNVLFLPIDDLNDWIEPLGGYAGVHTPNFQRLKRHTLMFTKAYAQVPVCQGSRAALMFSVPSYESGVYTHRSGDWIDSKLADKDKYKSIVRYFRNQGYETIGIGKNFHDGWRGPGRRNAANDASAWDTFNYCHEDEDGCRVEQPGAPDGSVIKYGPTSKKTKAMDDVQRASWLIDNVLSKKREGKPFFAAFGLIKPHLPFIVPKEWFELYPLKDVHYPIGAVDPSGTTFADNDDVADLPPAARAMIRQFYADHARIAGSDEWKAVIRSYLAAISFCDHVLGLVLDGLYKGPNAENTIICVWSDHGWQLGEKLAWRKFTLWERATRVPLFIGGPGIKPGVSSMPVSSLDIYPTLAQLATGDQAKNLRGIALDRYCRGDRDKEPRDHALSTWALDVGAGRLDDKDKHFAVRDATHRLIRYGNGDVELYNTEADPYEIRNLAVRPTREDETRITRMSALIPTKLAPEVRPAMARPPEDDDDDDA